MNKAMLSLLSEPEVLLVRATEPAALATLDEDEVGDLLVRVRRARNKYSTNYRRQSSKRVVTKGSRGAARGSSNKTAMKAEIFEDALARVSRRLAALAKQSASDLRAERLAAARGDARTAPAKAPTTVAAKKSAADGQGTGAEDEGLAHPRGEEEGGLDPCDGRPPAGQARHPLRPLTSARQRESVPSRRSVVSGVAWLRGSVDRCVCMDADAYGRGHEIPDEVVSRRALRRLLRVVVPTVTLMVVALAVGIWWGFVVALGSVVLGSAIWDFMPSHRRSRGGWIAPGMGSLSGDAGFVASSQGNNSIDATGRVWTAKTKQPTPEQAAAGYGGAAPSLLAILLECVAYVACIALAVLAVGRFVGL